MWWDELTEPVPDDMRREDGHRTFGLMELAVRGPWRGQGVEQRLHKTLLNASGAERVLLNVHPASKAASAAYRAWGYRKIGEARPWGGNTDLHFAARGRRPRPQGPGHGAGWRRTELCWSPRAGGRT